MKKPAHYLPGNFSIFPKGGRSSTTEVPGCTYCTHKHQPDCMRVHPIVLQTLRKSYNTIRQMFVCMFGRATIQSGRCLYVCSDELQYNQADICMYVRTSYNTIRQKLVCTYRSETWYYYYVLHSTNRQKRIWILGGKCTRWSPIQSGLWGNERATYNQPRQVDNSIRICGVQQQTYSYEVA